MKIENFEQAQKINNENRLILKEIDCLDEFINKLKNYEDNKDSYDDKKSYDYINDVGPGPWNGKTECIIEPQVLKKACEIILESFKDRHAKNLVLFEKL